MKQIGILLLALSLFGSVSADEPRKIALLVGVSDYQTEEVQDLKYAENDIKVVGSQLKQMGFEVTRFIAKDACQRKFVKAWIPLSRRRPFFINQMPPSSNSTSRLMN